MKIETPCNVGDIVYTCDFGLAKVKPAKVQHIEVHIDHKYGISMWIEFATAGCCTDADFGKKVFANSTDAQAAIDQHKERMKQWTKKN